MSRSLRGETCVITGAASGIGRALALGLHREGMRLVLVDLNLAGLDEVCGEIRAAGGEAHAFRCDVSSPDYMHALAAFAIESLGHVYMLINNAGIGSGGLVEELRPEEWRPNLDVNLWSIIYSLDAFLPHLIERRAGHIVNVGSGAGIVGIPYHIPYVVSKFAVTGATEALYSELSQSQPNIAVSLICPYFLQTRIIDRSDLQIPKRLLAEEHREEAARRMDEFKQIFWRKYTAGALPVEKAAARYIKGIKRRRLYIFDNPVLHLAQFIKAIPGPAYGWVLRAEERRHINLIRECFNEMGIPTQG